jgi:hypothetical protein
VSGGGARAAAAGARPHEELVRHGDRAGRSGALGHPVLEQPEGLLGEGAAVEPHGREGGGGVGGELDVVEARHEDVVRHAQAARCDAVQCAERQRVGERDEGVERHTAGLELLERPRRRRDGPRERVELERRVVGDPGLCEGVAVSGEAEAARRRGDVRLVVAADDGDPPGSALDEVTRDVARRGPAVDEDPIGELLLDLSDEDDRREVVGVLDDAVLETDRVEDEAVDEVRAGPRHELLLAPRLRGGLLDLHGETPLVRDVHDVVEEVGGERRGEVGERHGDRARTAVAEPAGAEIGDEVELGHRRLDALHGLGAHEHGAGDDVRDGLRRHPGEGGHVLHRRPRRSCHVLRIGEAVTG